MFNILKACYVCINVIYLTLELVVTYYNNLKCFYFYRRRLVKIQTEQTDNSTSTESISDTGMC